MGVTTMEKSDGAEDIVMSSNLAYETKVISR